jgi:hypothetical protein
MVPRVEKADRRYIAALVALLAACCCGMGVCIWLLLVL